MTRLYLNARCSPWYSSQEILDILSDPAGPLTPHDIFEFLTSCDTVASLDAVVSAVNMRASYNNVSVGLPSEAAGACERVEWWQSRAVVHAPPSKSPTKAPNPPPPVPLPKPHLKVQPPKTAGLDEELNREVTRWQTLSAEQEGKQAADDENTTGSVCSVCGMRPGYDGRILKQYGAQLLHSILMETANRSV